MTLRISTCEELCRDNEAAKTMANIYWNLEKSSTPAAVLLPWLPTHSRRTNKRSTRDLYDFILKYVLDRRAAGAPTKDPIDVLIQRGDNDVGIVTVSVVTESLLENEFGIGFSPPWVRCSLESSTLASTVSH